MQSRSCEDTRSAGRRLAADLRAGDCILLEGGLGAGKTEFARGLAEGLGVSPDEVRSPTFTLVNIYSGRLPVYHIDLYRIEKSTELRELGLEEILGTDGVAIVEWPGRLGSYMPKRALTVRLTDLGGESREITIEDRRG
jgi:tRNA threonylcarbamoyladenosine biosynthesis protein TsaE